MRTTRHARLKNNRRPSLGSTTISSVPRKDLQVRPFADPAISSCHTGASTLFTQFFSAQHTHDAYRIWHRRAAWEEGR